MTVLPACIHVYHVCVYAHGTEVKGGGEPARVCEELNWGLLEEPQVLVTNEPSPTPRCQLSIHIISAPVGLLLKFQFQFFHFLIFTK